MAAIRVLCVEDLPYLLAGVICLLESLGYEVRGAADGIEGFALAKAWHPDVIVSDVSMPRLDGHGMLAALRANADTAAIPVVFHTGEFDAVAALLAAGAVAVVIKGTKANHLIDTVAEVAASTANNRCVLAA